VHALRDIRRLLLDGNDDVDRLVVQTCATSTAAASVSCPKRHVSWRPPMTHSTGNGHAPFSTSS
jgi:hypothetical protein